MKSLFNRWLPGLTLGAWAAAIFSFAGSNLLNEILAGSFHTYALIAASVMTVGMLIFFFFKMDANCCSAAECGHGLSRSNLGKILSFLVLLLPASAAFWASPAALSKIQMENRMELSVPPSIPKRPNKDTVSTPPKPVDQSGSQQTGPATQQQSKDAEAALNTQDFLTRDESGNIVSEILDLLYAAQDSVLRKDFDGKKISLLAQMMPESSNNPNGNRFKAVRMFMVCCAADARPISTLVEVEKLPDLPEMTWVKIIGTATFPIENGKRMSLIRAEHIEKTEPPKDAMVN